MKPMLLIVTAIVAFGSIVARADPIDTEHLFGFTIGTDVGEIGEKERYGVLASVPAPIPRSPTRFPWNIRRDRIFVSN